MIGKHKGKEKVLQRVGLQKQSTHKHTRLPPANQWSSHQPTNGHLFAAGYPTSYIVHAQNKKYNHLLIGSLEYIEGYKENGCHVFRRDRDVHAQQDIAQRKQTVL